MNAEKLTVKQIEKTAYGSTICGVYDEIGFEIGKIEGEEVVERVRYAGKTYGHDLKPRKMWSIIEILGDPQRFYSKHETRKSAVSEIARILS